jgi:hypothetical protein
MDEPFCAVVRLGFLTPRLRPCQIRFCVDAQVGLMLTGMVVDNVVFGTSAYNSQV